MEEYERGWVVTLYPSVCGLGLAFGWDPLYLSIIFGPLHIEWVA